MSKIQRYLPRGLHSNSRKGRWAAQALRGLFAVLALSIMPSCYSSTAVKGTPVNDIALAQDKKLSGRAAAEADREILAAMSRVTSNNTFVEYNGIPEYRIGPQDILEITSYSGDKSTMTTVTVDSRGKISYSFIDDVEVAGMTSSQLDAVLSERLSSYVRKPRVSILVKEFKSKSAMLMGEFSSLRATTYGQAAASGRINLQGKTDLLDLISLGGGYTVDADIKNIKLIRQGRTYLINLYDIVEKGDQELNVIIDDGDVVNIPELPQYGERIYVMGEVNSQGIYSLKDARDLLAAISLAGSFTRVAKEENTLIVRGREQGKKPLVMMADLNALLRKADISQNIPLEDGDLIYVPRMVIADVNDWITNTLPLLNILLYPYDFDTRYFKRRQLTID